MSLKKFKTDFAKMMETYTIPDNISQEESDKKWSDLFSYLQSNIPNKLYRFRKCRLNDIISFEQGTISLCTAAQFSDKYDSTVFYNYKTFNSRIYEAIEFSIKFIIKIYQKNPSLLPQTTNVQDIINLHNTQHSDKEICDYFFEGLKGFISFSLENIKQQELFPRNNKNIKIACFTEDIKSKFMWDEYGDGYQGFALEYNFSNCQLTSNAHLYPVIYSKFMFDATKTIDNIIIPSFFEYINVNEQNKQDFLYQLNYNKSEFNRFYPTDELYWIKMYLFKDKNTYSHEKEWRLLYKSDSQKDFCSIRDEDCLKAIYYGPDIKDDYKQHLHNIAKSKGIKEYDVVLDKDSLKYDLKITSIKL